VSNQISQKIGKLGMLLQLANAEYTEVVALIQGQNQKAIEAQLQQRKE
jgi:hypothetical protein